MMLRRPWCRGFAAPAWSTVTPINPQTLPRPRIRRAWRRRLLGLALLGGGAYAWDQYYNARAISRTLRTLYVGSIIAADYKLNFNPSKSDRISRLHERNANRIFDLLISNGGLYIKIGQALAMQSAILPPAFQQKFAILFDSAPSVSFARIEKLFLEEFGTTPNEYFLEFDHRPAASASVAQVHKARLKDGRLVAIKLQKPEIATQLEWDLWSYKALMWTYEKLFDLPTMFAVEFFSEHFRQECDFVNEAKNSQRSAAYFQQEPALRHNVYVPEVFPEFSSKRVMTAEWIDGVRLSDLDGLNGLGISKKQVMQIMVDLFSAQMFKFGYLHCDPHPGNIIIRKKSNGKPELVLIDHGLYVSESADFRQKYCLLWKSLFTFDNEKIREIALGWGIHSPDLFASATLLRPYEGGGNEILEALSQDDPYKTQLLMKQKIKDFLKETEKLPLELMFIGRSMRIVQGNNQQLGSPVNRIKITASWASRSLISQPNMSVANKVRAWFSHFKFLSTCFVLDVTFYLTRIGQVVFRRKDGFEDLIEKSMEKQMRGLGVEVNHNVFDG